jgi:flagellar hook-associated protein 1 FlgK
MTSTFSGISGALSALQAQRRGLDVTGQNIANANTEGYSRQRVMMESKGASVTPAIWSASNGVGDGVNVSDVERVRNEFLEGRGRAEHAKNSYLTNQAQVYAQLEASFGEPSDTGLQMQMAELWTSFDDVANNTSVSGSASRTTLIEKAATLADGLNNAHDALSSQWASRRGQLVAHVDDVNTTAATIANLNDTIRRATAAGLPVNELADKRDGYVMHLAEVAGATANARDDGTVDLYLDGSSLVSGNSSRRLQLTGAGRLADQGADPVRLSFTDTGNPATVAGTMGSVGDALSTVLPEYAASLDDVAAKLAGTVNTVHAAGYGRDGVTGRPFFSGTTASTIAVAISDPDHVAASSSATATLDGSNADKLARLGTAPGGPDTAYRQMIAKLGVASQAVTRRSEIQGSITEQSDAARTSESGVSLDEEMTNLLSYQRAYEAASRVISTVDSVLDVLINRMAV